MRLSKALAGIACALVLFGACNAALSFAFEPVGSVSEVKWQDYQATEHIDTLVVGSSLANEAFDVAVLDEALGTSTYTLAAPAQTIAESYAAVQTAYADHQMNRVILGVSLRMLYVDSAENPSSTFFRERARVVGLSEAASTALDVLAHGNVIGSADSINCLFPWVKTHVNLNGPSSVVENIQQKLSNPTPLEAMAFTDPMWNYQGNGFASYDYTIEIDKPEGLHFFDRDEYVDVLTDSSKADTLVRLCDFCAQHDIELIVASVTVPDFSLLNYADEYFSKSDQIAQLVSDHGGSYVDFNLIKPEYLPATYEKYFDGEHFNVRGARLFSSVFAEYVKRLANGEDTSEMFCTPKERIESIDYLTLVRAEAQVTDDGVVIEARAFAGPQVDVEFAFDVRYAETDAYEQLRDWKAESTFTFVPEQHGIVHLQVRARQVGSNDQIVRSYPFDIYY